MLSISLMVLLASTGIVTTTVPICIEGYIMDQYCIDRGTLLDNPSVDTLQEPQKHSLHCLVDVQRCIDSGFTVLLPNPTGHPKYGVAVKLDSTGTTFAVELARKIGMSGGCTTCGHPSSNITHGFRATVFGDLSNDQSPPLLKVNTFMKWLYFLSYFRTIQ